MTLLDAANICYGGFPQAPNTLIGYGDRSRVMLPGEAREAGYVLRSFTRESGVIEVVNAKGEVMTGRFDEAHVHYALHDLCVIDTEPHWEPDHDDFFDPRND